MCGCATFRHPATFAQLVSCRPPSINAVYIQVNFRYHISCGKPHSIRPSMPVASTPLEFLAPSFADPDALPASRPAPSMNSPVFSMTSPARRPSSASWAPTNPSYSRRSPTPRTRLLYAGCRHSAGSRSRATSARCAPRCRTTRRSGGGMPSRTTYRTSLMRPRWTLRCSLGT